MSQYLEAFSQILETENKDEAINYALGLLRENKLDIIDLYEDVLTPALNNMFCNLSDKDLCVWKEHVRTAIVRTIVECCYPFVIARRDQIAVSRKGTAVIMCPPEEYHDLGARMVADYFTICGFNTIYVGSNTPYDNFYAVADKVKPDIIAISVSNYYNLVITKKIILELRHKTVGQTKIIVGGYAFYENAKNVDLVGADDYALNFRDVKRIAEMGENV